MVGYNFSHGVRFSWNEQEYIVREDRGRDIVVQNLSYNEIRTLVLADLLSAWDDGALKFLKSSAKATKIVKPDLGLYTVEEKKAIEHRFNIIEPFINGKKPGYSVQNYLDSLSEPKPSKATFYRWLAEYNKFNDKRYIAPQTERRGPHHRRPDPLVFEQLVRLLDQKFYGGEEVPVISIFRSLKNWVKKENEIRDTKDKLVMISKDTLYRLVRELQDTYRKDVARHGRVQAELNKTGSSAHVIANRPLERVEVDWTPLDIFVVDTGTFKRERFFLLLAVDKCTTYPLGFHITFTEPNALDIKQCLLHAMLPKTRLKEMYPVVSNDWSAWGKPEEIVVDNAKVNESKDLEDVLRICGIDVQYCQVKAGNQKGTVEKLLGDINRVLHQFAGTTLSNPQERSQYNSEEKACITIIGLYKIIHKILVDIIGDSIHHDYGKTRHEMWEQGLELAKVHRTLPYSKQELKVLFGTGLEFRKITNKGVEILGQTYQSDTLMELRLKISRSKDINRVRIRFDKDDMRVVYVYDNYARQFIEVPATANSMDQKGIDDRYPVHYQQLADYSRNVHQNIANFDDTTIAEHFDDLDKIVMEDKAILRNIKRVKESSDNSKNTISNVSLNMLQKNHIDFGKTSIPDINTLDFIRDAAVEKPRIKHDKKSPRNVEETRIDSMIDYELEETKCIKKDDEDWGVFLIDP